MNKIFKVIWNEARNAYVVVSEIAKNHGSKSCSTKKLLAMLIATGVMTCASFDVLADEPSAAQTTQSQYVAFAPTTSSFPDEYEQTINGHKYIYDVANQYWVREGYILVLEQNAKLHTPLSTNGRAADVAYTGGGDTSSILQSVTSLVSASGTVTNMGESLNSINASAYAGVSHSGGTKVAGTWNYIIEDSSWKDSVAPGNYKYGYVDLVDSKLPKGFKTAEDPNTELTWNDTKQCYTYKGNPVDYSNIYVIDGKIGVFTNKDGSKVYTGNVFGKNNEVLMTVKDANNTFYSYWASEVTDPSATMQSYRMADYEKDLSVLLENEKKLYRNDIKEVTMTTDANSATIGLLRNGDTEAGAPVTGAITVTSGGGTEGSDTFVKISNGTANQTFATGSKVEVNGPADAITGIKVNGVDYTIKQGSGVKVEQDAANKTTTITVDGNATTITDTDTTYTAGDGIEINGGNAISVSKNLIGMESIQGAGEGKISFDGDNVKVNNTTFGENSVVVGVAGDGKHPVRIDGETGRITGLANTKVGYTDFANDKGTAATEGQLKQVMDEGWKFTTDSNEKTTVKVGPDGTNDNAVTFKGDGTNIAVTNTGKDIKVALKKDLTVDSVKAGDFFMDKNKGVGYVDKAYITSSGLNANNQKITGVADGNNDTDAVNFGQLKKVSNNLVNVDFTNISNNGKTEIVNIAKAADVHVKDGQYSVQTDGTVTMKYVDGNGDEVTGNELKITDVASATKLNALNNTVTNIDGRVTTNSTNITTLQGEVITSGSIGANGKVELTKKDGGKVEVGTVKDYSVTSGTYDQTTKKLTLTKNDAYGNATSGTVDIDRSGIQSGDKNWTAQANGTDVKPNADNKVNFINGDNTNVTTSGDGVIAVNLNKNLNGLTSVTTNNAYVTEVNEGDKTSVTNVKFVEDKIAGVTLTAGDGISITDKKINVKLKEGEQNLVVDSNGLALNTALTGIQSINGTGAGSISFADGGIKLNNKVTIDNNGKISGVAAGEVSSTSTDAINGSQLHQTNENVAALDKRVTQNEADIATNKANIAQNAADIAQNKADIAQNKADIAQNKADIAQNKTDIKNLDNRVTNVEELAKKHTTVTAGDNITVTEDTNKDGGKEYNVALKNNIDLGDNGSVTTGQTVMNNDGLKVGDKVSVTATAVTAGKTSISDEGVKVGDKTYISDNGLNANNKVITNVADGKENSDAVNYGQLKGVENQVISNTNRINQLGSRVNKVGAGAAALAALHPMDFDPDDKLTFSAGYGNYAGENAAAIGAYYRPDEKVMFSVAGTVGNGENMVNAGVSFALDRTNHVSNSRTALAREVIDLRGQLAVMGAKMAKMEKAFGMLDETKTKLFPDVPANHWAYEYIAKLAGNGYIEGYPDGNFGGDRLMTRYEFAAMLYRAIENGAALEEKIIKEFEPELGRIRVDRISGEDGDRDKIERVRVNDTKGERDHYGNKLAK